MDIKPLSNTLSVSGQIRPRDMAEIAKLGFKTVINNRPDREVPFQPRHKTLAARAEQAGLQYYYLPVISGEMTQKNVDDFAEVLKRADGPVFAFCRTGTRSSNLWARANPDDLSGAEITSIGARHGYAL